MIARLPRPLDARWGVPTLALAALLVAALLPTSANAAPASGDAFIRLADHDRGRTLSGQGVTVAPQGEIGTENGMLKLPIVDVDLGSAPSATPNGWLRFQKGKRGIAFTDMRFDLSAGVLTGKLAGEEVPVFRLGAETSIDRAAGNVSVQAGKLRLIRAAATLVRQKLGLERALRGDGVGMVWLAGQAKPAHAAAQSVVAGSVDWGVLFTWRNYILNVPPSGSVEIGDGATATGPLNVVTTTYGFPVSAGSYERGLYGAADRYAIKSQGYVTFKKPMHCINEVKLSDLEVRVDGQQGSLVANTFSNIDQPPFPCTALPDVNQTGATIATLDLSGVAPEFSNDGKTVTWSAVPTALTEQGSIVFGNTYPAGTPFDPISVEATTE